MALVTLQRSPSPSNSPEHAESEGDLVGEDERSPLRQRSFSESYFAVKGAALILPQSECTRKVSSRSHGGDIQSHLQSMLHLLRPQDTLKVAVKLESAYPKRNRYMAVVSCIGRQDTEECVILGIDCNNEKATIGLVLPIWANTKIKLDGDGGFSINSEGHHHLFKPVSVQAMWSALQSLHKVVSVATSNHYFTHGLTHTWVGYYHARTNSDQPSISEWHLMEDIMPLRAESSQFMHENTEEDALQPKIKASLREIMMTVDLEEVTSKFLRTRLEEHLGRSLQEYKSYIDQEMLIIMGQMDAPTEVFDYLYLGSEWNASNLEELKDNGIGYLLNVTREIDNFFPGMFNYMNIREYDVEETDLLKYWEKTYKFIHKVRKGGSKVLVHCKMGVSRSASTVIAYIMKDRGWSLEETYDFVRQKRSCIKPNKSFMKQLEIYQGILNASRQRFIFKSKSENNLTDTGDLLEDLTDPNGEGIFLGEPLHLTRPQSWAPEDDIAASILRRKGLARSDDGEEYGDLPVFRLGGEEADVELSSRSTDSVEMSLPDIPSPTNIKPDDDTIQQFELPVPSSFSSYVTSTNGSGGGIIFHKNDTDWKYRGKSPSASPMGSPKGESVLLGPHPAMLGGCFTNSSTPYAFRVRDDSSWIKEASPDTPNGPQMDSEGLVPTVDDPLHPDTCDPDTDVKFYLEADYLEPAITTVSTCALQQQQLFPTETQSVSLGISQTKSEYANLKPEMGVRQHYVKEAIPWHPGMVRKQLQDFEHRIRCENTIPEASDLDPSSAGVQNQDEPYMTVMEVTTPDDQEQMGMAVGYNSQNPCGLSQPLLSVPTTAVRESQSFHGLSTPPEEASEGLRARPASVYEIEDIQLPVGIVQRTKQEIEEKQRPTPREWIETSFSDLDPMSKLVQRSSSLKVDKGKTKSRKSRSSDRRKTCTPILSPSINSPGASLSSPALFPMAIDPAALQLPVQVFKYGNEEVPLELGKVRRHTQDYENLSESRPKGTAQDEEVTDPDSEQDEVFLRSSEKEVITPEDNAANTIHCRGKDIDDQVRETCAPDFVNSKKNEEFGNAEEIGPSRIVAKTVTSETLIHAAEPAQNLTKVKVKGNSLADPLVGEKVTEPNSCATKDSKTSEVEDSANINSILVLQSPKPAVNVRRESCLNKETLFLIREIGSALLNQPMKTEEDEAESTGKSVSLVKQLVKRIEHKSQVKPKPFLDRIVIIDKDTLSKQSVAASKQQTDVEVPCLKPKQTVEQTRSEGDKKVLDRFTITGARGKLPRSELALGEVDDKSSTKTSPPHSTDRQARLSDLSLDLGTDIESSDRVTETTEIEQLSSPRDEQPIDGLEAIEDHRVKNLVGKFEVKEEVKKSTELELLDNDVQDTPSMTSADATTSLVEPVAPSPPIDLKGDSPPMTRTTDNPLTNVLTRSASLEDVWTLHRVSDAANVPADPSAFERFEDSHPTAATNMESNEARKPRPTSVILRSTCTLGSLKPADPHYRRNVRSLSSLRRTPSDSSRSGPHQFLPTSEQGFNMDGRKVRRLEGKTHPLAKLGWQHSTM